MIIFGVDMSSWVHLDNKKKDILIPGDSPAQGLEKPLRKSIRSILINNRQNLDWASNIMNVTAIYLLMVLRFINSK